MSDYISKSDVIKIIEKEIGKELEQTSSPIVHNALLHVKFGVGKLPAVDEKEIIRKTIERIVKKLEENALGGVMGPQLIPIKSAIKIVKEEGGLNE